jgi:general secretion pathway protein B
MSYILDALKKAERERGLAQVPTLSTVHDLRAKPPIRLWVLSGFFVLCIALFLWFFFFGLDTDDEMAALPRDESSLDTRSPEAHATSDADVSREINARVNGAGVEMSRAGVQEPVMDERQVIPSNSPATESRAETTGGAATAGRTAAIPQPSAYASDVSVGDQTGPLPIASQKMGARSEEPQPSSDIVGEEEISLQEAMDEMTMSILLYAENKAERLVFINGRKYVEGDKVEGKYLLESITSEGAVLSHSGERAMLRPGRK